MEELLGIINNNTIIRQLLQNCPYSILVQMKPEYFKSKRFYLAQGERHQFVYIVVSGSLKIFVSDDNNRQILLDIYKEGNLIGEQEAFLNETYSASVENTKDCLLIKIPNQAFVEWVATDANFNRELIQSLCEQMYELTNRAAKYSLTTVKSQVISTLLELQESNPIIDKKILFQSVSATQRSVYRVLNELQSFDLINVGAKSITINDLKKLTIERKKN